MEIKPFFGLDFTPFGFVFTGFVITWSMLYHRCGEVVPASYEMAVQSMSDGVLVADRCGRILSANRAAREIFGVAGIALGDNTLAELLPQGALSIDALPRGPGDDEPAREREIALAGPEGRKVYSLRRSWVFERRHPVS